MPPPYSLTSYSLAPLFPLSPPSLPAPNPSTWPWPASTSLFSPPLCLSTINALKPWTISAHLDRLCWSNGAGLPLMSHTCNLPPGDLSALQAQLPASNPFSVLPRHTAASGMSESKNLLSLASEQTQGPQNWLFCCPQRYLWCPRVGAQLPQGHQTAPSSPSVWDSLASHIHVAAWGWRSQTSHVHLAYWPSPRADAGRHFYPTHHHDQLKSLFKRLRRCLMYGEHPINVVIPDSKGRNRGSIPQRKLAIVCLFERPCLCLAKGLQKHESLWSFFLFNFSQSQVALEGPHIFIILLLTIFFLFHHAGD